MGICSICKTINNTCKCGKCGFDENRDYRQYRFICQLLESDRKKLESELLADNVLI